MSIFSFEHSDPLGYVSGLLDVEHTKEESSELCKHSYKYSFKTNNPDFLLSSDKEYNKKVQ